MTLHVFFRIFAIYMRRIGTIILGIFGIVSTCIADTDTSANIDRMGAHHFGFEISALPGRVIAADRYEKRWLQNKRALALKAGMRYSTLPQDSDEYARDFGYPTFVAGIQYGLNRGVTMHREKDTAWGLLEPVDYTSRMGNIVTLYGTFERPVFRSRKWQGDYTLSVGVGYSSSKYNTHDAIDNELIGSRWLIYFGAGVHATYRIAENWGLRGGLDFYHHSNGATNRPNKGANMIAPSIGVVYGLFGEKKSDSGETEAGLSRRAFKPYSFLEVATSMGVKTLNEDWQLTQFHTPPGDPDYRTSRFKRYLTYSFHASVLRRYARRWASGVGVDVYRVSYAQRVEDIERAEGIDSNLDPWSFGVSGKHRVYYHNLSLHLSLGYYLHRKMGNNAKQVEGSVYEHVGIYYSFPRLNRFSVGLGIKAHNTKADCLELTMAYPIVL
jgi:hypothetical protein